MIKKNISRNIIYGLIVFVLLSLQMSNVIALLEINPDIMLVLAILHALYYGEQNGTIFGFGIGLLEDVLSGTLFGMNAFILSLVSFLTGVYKKYIFVSDIVAFLIYIVLATIVKYILYIVFFSIFQKTDFLNGMLFLKLAGEIAYNVIIGIIFFLAAPKLYKRDENPF